jgi:hypothetical protein
MATNKQKCLSELVQEAIPKPIPGTEIFLNIPKYTIHVLKVIT